MTHSAAAGSGVAPPARSDSLESWLRLFHTPGLGPRRVAHLIARHGHPETVLAMPSQHWGIPGLPDLDMDAETLAQREAGIERDLAWLAADARHHIITRDAPDYPGLLADLPDPPPLLYMLGEVDLLHSAQIAVVGSREATPQGLVHARHFAQRLAEAGLTITSGLALGIDAAAHEGALLCPQGKTVAVVATGADRVYPARHRRLAHRIADQGLLVSLWPIGTAPQATHFPQRNRVISGLAFGTLVVEAALRSGSLITARLAAEQGRSVYAIPGSILSRVSRGCHRLIKEGAQLVETPDEILDDLADWLGVPTTQRPALPVTQPPERLDPEQQKILDAMGFDPVTLETLIQRTGLTIDAISAMLVIMELNGRVAALSHGRYQRLDAGRTKK